MIPVVSKFPYYAKIACILIALYVIVFALQVAATIIIPIVFSIIFAILLNPFVNLLIKHGFNRILAIALAVTIALILVIGIVYVIITQISLLAHLYPNLKLKLNDISAKFMYWVTDTFNLKKNDVIAWVDSNQASTFENLEYTKLISELLRLLFVGMLIPVYVLMILYYKPLLLDFIRKLFHVDNHIAVTEVLVNSKKIIQSYLVGLFFELILVAILNSVGLLLLGIEYAVVLGITGALLNIIPYIGGIIAISLPILVAFVTQDSLLSCLMVFLVYLFIQFIDNNYILPRIVASRVKINALISIIAVLIGGAIWGIPGMFLSIPITAILKVIFDHIESLKPWGLLLGNVIPTKLVARKRK